MLGLDYSGKTTILYHIKNGECAKTKPTIGFNAESIDYKDAIFTIFEAGGQKEIRVLWKHYYQHTDGLFFVVDSNDIDRIKEAAEDLKKLSNEEELKIILF